jgi:hypothetical protein
LNDISDETVIAFVDGRLHGAPLAAFEERLAQDEGLAARIAAHRWMARQIVAAYGPPPETEIDDTLLARLRLGNGAVQDEKVVALADYRRTTTARRRIWSISIGAIAASLAAGVMIGHGMLSSGAALISGHDGQLVADGALAAGLSDRLAGQPGPIRIGISFRTASGICRTFHTPQGASGLGCRAGGQWHVPIMVAGGDSVKGGADYRLAAGGESPSVMTEVDRRIRGEPLTPAEEARLRGNGWE